MTSSRPSSAQSLFKKLMQLGVAVPAVMAHRLTRMALAGPNPSARDRKEFELMGSEKLAAYAQGCQAMTTEMVRAQQEFGASLIRSFFMPALWGAPATWVLSCQFERAATDVIAMGLAPVHHTAVANAQRLGRTPLLNG